MTDIREEFGKGWNWRKMIPSDIYSKLLLNGLPGWDFDWDGDQYERMCYFVMGKGKQSRDIAIEADEWCTGMFYYADKTEDTLPFVDKGEEYVSFFSFQLKRDYYEFAQRYGHGDGPCSSRALEFAAEFGRTRRGWSDESIQKYLKG